MSRFLSEKYNKLTPYTPGEQPQDMKYVKLNTNESPFLPSARAQAFAQKAAQRLQLYSDPECKELVSLACETFGVEKDEILFTNGSDEILNFAFMAFCDKNTKAVFPNFTYGFYSVFASLNSVEYETIPLKEDFTVCAEDYIGVNKTIFIANPNAPTGIALPLEKIEAIIKGNPDNVVVIDEAYVDFGAESAVKLIHKYDNLLVTQTFSKSRSMAGGRLGFGVASKAIIRDLNTIKYSTNPYNVNSMTMAAGIGALKDEEYFKNNCLKIMKNREYLTKELENIGFMVLPSSANFVFAKHKTIKGKDIYQKLKENGVLVRHFETSGIEDFNRITVGSTKQIEILINTLKNITEGKV